MSTPADRKHDPDLVIGDALLASKKEIASLRAQLSERTREHEALERIIAAAGTPDPAEGCRIIIALARAALDGKEGK